MIDPFYSGDRFTLYNGDCLAVMAQMEACSVDAVVTDPPAGISFMGKDWDHHKGGRDAWVSWLTEVMRECLRVLKPGGHALVWALPRTSHWTGWAIESAGFEIRDRVSHLFGTGFPKSLDVSKQIDTMAGAEREVVGVETLSNDIRGNASNGKGISGPKKSRDPLVRNMTVPATNAAKQWSGWGTALKPACEDWWLCRKPLDGTVAQNVLKHGTGALNVDGCRVATDESLSAGSRRLGDGIKYGLCEPTTEYQQNSNGRWPSHITHDGSDEVVGLFSETSDSKSGGSRSASQIWGSTQGAQLRNGFDDSGSAARFFYCAKPDKQDREAGLQDLPLRSAGDVTDRTDGSDGLNSPRAGAGRTSGTRNVHPTIKSTELMRWLCRLITPPCGLVLDCFAGSGSTGKAAMLEGFRFIGIELSTEYCELAQRRIEAVTAQQSLFTPEQLAATQDDEPAQSELFATVGE